LGTEEMVGEMIIIADIAEIEEWEGTEDGEEMIMDIPEEEDLMVEWEDEDGIEMDRIHGLHHERGVEREDDEADAADRHRARTVIRVPVIPRMNEPNRSEMDYR